MKSQIASDMALYILIACRLVYIAFIIAVFLALSPLIILLIWLLSAGYEKDLEGY